MKCGLLGRKLSHSYSPQIHTLLGDYDYSLFEKEPEELDSFLKDGKFTGLNVTIPYKKDVIAYLDVLSPVAAKLGDSGRIRVRESGTEPVIRVMVEAPDKEICEACVAQVVDVICAKGHAVV